MSTRTERYREVTVNNIKDVVTNQTLQCILNTNVDPASIDCVLPSVEECTEADDIEACFEENMTPEDFETLSAALQRGLNTEIFDTPGYIKQFCRYM